MRRILSLSLLFATVSLFNSCATTEYGSSREPDAPAVYIPRDLDETERRLVYDVERVLTRAGYRISSGRSAEYELDFRIESGPINTDTNLRLLHEGREIVSAYARSSGILAREQTVRDSFDKCLYEFEAQVPRPTISRYDSGPGPGPLLDDRSSYFRESDRGLHRQSYDRGPSGGYGY
ncbi:hypothetical protein FEM03_16050 [Phragmitibacter flavus]|uniref:DUF4136 domain-containing protein n=1 Tax=Phragmitibacter flavus TaxID=2576071 RepID=A0A5R8KBZ9_9BACT|nr:hypothetical protein [Phragmitibacter flavus]TLD69832.1 hypothetical protein FEM03_16050 [Phragmitibacter flavus]